MAGDTLTGRMYHTSSLFEEIVRKFRPTAPGGGTVYFAVSQPLSGDDLPDRGIKLRMTEPLEGGGRGLEMAVPAFDYYTGVPGVMANVSSGCAENGALYGKMLAAREGENVYELKLSMTACAGCATKHKCPFGSPELRREKPPLVFGNANP